MGGILHFGLPVGGSWGGKDGPSGSSSSARRGGCSSERAASRRSSTSTAARLGAMDSQRRPQWSLLAAGAGGGGALLAEKSTQLPLDACDGIRDEDSPASTSGKASSWPFAVLSHIGQSKGVDVGAIVRERSTGIPFPKSLHDDCGSVQILGGVGMRGKSLAKLKTIKIYAFGLYIDPKTLVRELGAKYAGADPASLKNSEAFYKDLVRRNLDISLRLVIHYNGLSMGDVRGVFEKSLRKRLVKVGGNVNGPDLKTFAGMFDETMKIGRGTTITFRCSSGRLTTHVNGRKLGVINSAPLCRALLDLYVGDQPTSKATKEMFGQSVAMLIKAHASS
eukprot:jgi/Chlat1/4635/Chrsp3S05592